MVPRLHSLRSRLVALVLIASIPTVGLYLYFADRMRSAIAEEVQENALRLARLASVEHERSIDRTEQLLTRHGRRHRAARPVVAQSSVRQSLVARQFIDRSD